MGCTSNNSRHQASLYDIVLILLKYELCLHQSLYAKVADLQDALHHVATHAELVDLLFSANVPLRIGMPGFKWLDSTLI